MGAYSLLSPYLGSALAVAGLSKINPTLQKFIGYGTAAGYGTDQIIDFLRSKAESQGYKDLKKKLHEGEAEGTLRPDERATKERMRRTEMAPDIAQAAISTGAGLLGGLRGANIAGAKDRMRSDQNGQEPSQEEQTRMQHPSGSPVPQQGMPMREAANQPGMGQEAGASINPLDVLSDYSPQLARIIGMKIQHGSLPKDAAIVLKHNPGALKKIIDKIESDTHENFEDLIERIFGQREAQQAKVGNRKELMQQAQGGQKKSTIMQLLGQGNQMLDQLMRGKNG